MRRKQWTAIALLAGLVMVLGWIYPTSGQAAEFQCPDGPAFWQATNAPATPSHAAILRSHPARQRPTILLPEQRQDSAGTKLDETFRAPQDISASPYTKSVAPGLDFRDDISFRKTRRE